MTKRSCYQCGDDDIDAIRQKRTEEIRAYGRKVLADADAALLNQAPTVSDWDLEEDEEPEAPEEVEPTVEEPVEPEVEAVVEEIEEQPVVDEKPEKKASPKATVKK